MTENELTDVRFTDFFRRYTKTWIHAVATAGLTAFGTLTFVNRWFAVLAIGSYVLPPLVLYARASSTAEPDRERTDAQKPEPSSTTDSPSSTTPETVSRTDQDATESTTVASRDRRTVDAGGGRAVSRPTRIEEKPEPGAESTEPQTDGVEGETSHGDREAGTDTTERTVPGGREDDTEIRWSTVDPPTEADLDDVAVTDTDACAVGENGVVLAATGGEEWTVTLEDGPGARANDLHGVDATTGGNAVWVAGDSGALGRIETDTWRHVNYTAPNDITDNWLGIAVGGPSGDERVLLIDGSGQVLPGQYRDGDITWGETVTPGSGSSLSGVTLYCAASGYCCDTNDRVFETTDGAASFEPLDGVGASGTLTDLAAVEQGDCLVTADDGVVHRYDGTAWTPERVGEDDLAGIARDGEYTVVCGPEAVHERVNLLSDWEQYASDADESLLGVDVAGDHAVAVGEDGTVVERTTE